MRCQDKRDLAHPFALVRGEVGAARAYELFVDLRQLARDARPALGCGVGELAEGGPHAAGRLEEHDRLRRLADERDRLAPPRALPGQEADEPEPAVARDPARDDGGEDRTRARDG